MSTYFFINLLYITTKIANTTIPIINNLILENKNFFLQGNSLLLATNKLIKSTADYYVNKAITVLKEEKIKGREEECLEILQKIFMET